MSDLIEQLESVSQLGPAAIPPPQSLRARARRRKRRRRVAIAAPLVLITAVIALRPWHNSGVKVVADRPSTTATGPQPLPEESTMVPTTQLPQERQSSGAVAALPGGTTVYLDLYSGRPNPQFTLDPSELDLVNKTIAQLAQVPDPPTPDGGLGFRGFVLSATALGQTGESTVAVTPTSVEVTNTEQRVELSDPDGTVMRVLSRAVASQIDDPTLLALIEPWLN